MFIFQAIISVMLLLRIGGILLKRINVNDENRWMGNTYAFWGAMFGMFFANYYDQGNISSVLFYTSIVYISVAESLCERYTKGLRTAYVISGIFLIILFTLSE